MSPRRSEKRGTLNTQLGTTKDSVNEFFASYANFDYNPTSPIWDEFNRMCNLFDWEHDDFEMREAKQNFKSVIVKQFNYLYGSDVNNLESWQNLYRILFKMIERRTRTAT